MNISEYLEKFGRTLFEAPLATRPGTDEPPELGEIRLAILDHVREKSYRSGGKKVFPFDLVRLHVRGVDEGSRAAYEGRFFRKYLEQEVQNSLRAGGCRFPETLRVEVAASSGFPQHGEHWVTLESTTQEASAASPRAKLVVLEGAANVPEIRLTKARTNIGRVLDVYRAEGLFRRNDLTFAEETEINCSVSREHAHIRFDRVSNEYRLFNDRWFPRGPRGGECGTWIVRNGMSQEVHRDARGAKLEPGDEIHFGRAVVIFDLE